MSKKRSKVFVSYSRHDEQLVKPLADLLGVASDDAIFVDINSLKPGDDWEKKIIEAIQQSTVFVLCWCCESKKSPFVAQEIAHALVDGTNRRLVPVLFCSATLPEGLLRYQWIDLRGQVAHTCTGDHAPPDVLAMRPDDGLKGSDESRLLRKYLGECSDVAPEVLEEINAINAITAAAASYFRSLQKPTETPSGS